MLSPDVKWIVKKNILLIMLLLFFVLPAALTGADSSVDEALKNAMKDDTFVENNKLEFKFKGEFKNLFTMVHTDHYQKTVLSPPEEKFLVTDMKRLRLSGDLFAGSILTLHVDFDNEVYTGSYNNSLNFSAYWTPSTYNDFIPLYHDPVETDDILYRIKLLNAYAKLVLGRVTMTIGQQQIRFGSGKLWNPLDIITPVSPTFVEGPEEQKGTTAFRGDFYFNRTTELSVVYFQSKNSNTYESIGIADANGIMRFKTAIQNCDIAVLGGWVVHRLIFGGDASVSLFDGLLRAAAVYFHPEDNADYFQLNAGYEYTIQKGPTLYIEYFYNSSSLKNNSDLSDSYRAQYAGNMSQEVYLDTGARIITQNSHYIACGGSWEFLPLWNGNLMFIYDVEGQGVFIAASVKYNILQNLNLNIGIMYAEVFERENYPSDFETFHRKPFGYFSLDLHF